MKSIMEIMALVTLAVGLIGYQGNTEPVRMECTAYSYGVTTASGVPVREGICAAKKEWIGKTALVYKDDDGKIGELLGIYEILDTGGDNRIKNGTCIDIYLGKESECLEWGRRQVYVQIVDAEG